MQTFLTILIVSGAVLYVVRQWVPMRRSAAKGSGSAMGSSSVHSTAARSTCGTCGGCSRS